MKRNRTIIFMLSAMLVLGALLSGCRGEQKATNANSPGELLWYFMNTPQPGQGEVYAKANEIIRKKLGVNVKFSPIDGGSYDEKMKVIIAAQEYFDLCFTSHWANNYLNNVSRGAFLPIDDLLTRYAPKLKASIPEHIWDAAKVDGKLYAAINYQIVALQRGWTFRKDLVDKYNFDISSVKKYTDIEPFLKKIKENEPNVYGLDRMDIFAIPALADGIIELGVTGFYVRMDDPDLKVIHKTELPEYKEFLKTSRDWYLKGYCREDIVTATDVDAYHKAGRYASSGNFMVKPGGLEEGKRKYGFEYVEVTLSEPVLDQLGAISSLTAISRTSKAPEKAMQLLELMNTDKELYNLLSFGIEGKHYKKLSNGHIDLITGGKDGYTMANWQLGNVFNSYITEGMPDDVWEKTKKMNEQAKTTPVFGFKPNLDVIKSQVAQVESVVKEMELPLETGSVEPEEALAKYREKLKLAGLEDIRKELQKQLKDMKNK